MENEYETNYIDILQEQIKRQDNIINKLIKTNVLIALILAVVMCVFTISYFWSDYEFFTNSNNTTITGDSNTSVKDSSLKNSEMNLE